MTCKKQNKILNDKIEYNVNQYKVDRLNAEISAFSSGDLNKYKFLTRKYLNYKPNALDKARFEFSPLGQTFSTGLDKTAQGYQEEGVIKLLKDIRDGLAGGNRPNNRPNNDDGDDGDDGVDKKNKEEKYTDMADLETEEDAAKRIADSYEQKKDNYDDIIKKLNDRILYLDTKQKIVNYQMKKKII